MISCLTNEEIIAILRTHDVLFPTKIKDEDCAILVSKAGKTLTDFLYSNDKLQPLPVVETKSKKEINRTIK